MKKTIKYSGVFLLFVLLFGCASTPHVHQLELTQSKKLKSDRVLYSWFVHIYASYPSEGKTERIFERKRSPVHVVPLEFHSSQDQLLFADQGLLLSYNGNGKTNEVINLGETDFRGLNNSNRYHFLWYLEARGRDIAFGVEEKRGESPKQYLCLVRLGASSGECEQVQYLQTVDYDFEKKVVYRAGGTGGRTLVQRSWNEDSTSHILDAEFMIDSIQVHEQTGKLLVSTVGGNANGNIWIYDPESGRRRVVARGVRAKPVWIGRKMVLFSANENRLILADVSSGEIHTNTLLQFGGAESEEFGPNEPAVGPEGNLVAWSFKVERDGELEQRTAVIQLSTGRYSILNSFGTDLEWGGEIPRP